MSSAVEIAEIKERLREINKEQVRIDKQIQKQEDDGNFDNSLYEMIDKLEDERNNLQMRLESLEN